MNLLSILFPQTIYKTTSKFSGEIKIIDHVFDRRLVVGGLTQSGGILYAMWEKAIKQLTINNSQLTVKDVLILGLGAGTVVEIVNKKWPDAHIDGVEIDPVIVNIGKKYFQLNNSKNLTIIINDAMAFVNNATMKQSNNYDLIIVDLYKGFFIEKNVQNERFLQKIGKKLSKNGIVIFNVISSQNTNFEATIFLDKISRIFKDYFCKRIMTNIFFFCANPTPKGGDLSMAKKKKKKKR